MDVLAYLKSDCTTSLLNHGPAQADELNMITKLLSRFNGFRTARDRTAHTASAKVVKEYLQLLDIIDENTPDWFVRDAEIWRMAGKHFCRLFGGGVKRRVDDFDDIELDHFLLHKLFP